MPRGKKQRFPGGPKTTKQFQAFAIKCKTGSSRVLGSSLSQAKACEIVNRGKGGGIAKRAARSARRGRR